MESCYLTLNEKRFPFLIRCLGFDDIRDRVPRKPFAKLAIRDINYYIDGEQFSKIFLLECICDYR